MKAHRIALVVGLVGFLLIIGFFVFELIGHGTRNIVQVLIMIVLMGGIPLLLLWGILSHPNLFNLSRIAGFSWSFAAVTTGTIAIFFYTLYSDKRKYTYDPEADYAHYYIHGNDTNFVLRNIFRIEREESGRMDGIDILSYGYLKGDSLQRLRLFHIQRSKDPHLPHSCWIGDTATLEVRRISLDRYYLLSGTNIEAELKMKDLIHIYQQEKITQEVFLDSVGKLMIQGSTKINRASYYR